MNPGKVILFGVDGATWRILRKAIDDGKCPHFAETIDSGASGTLWSTKPYRTIPAWTSCFTGVNPGKHGMVDNIIKIGDEFVVCGSQHREVDTIWNLMSRRGEELIVVNDPVAYPPEKIGIHITGFLTQVTTDHFVEPIELKKTLDKIADGYVPEPKPIARRYRRNSPEKSFEILSQHGQKIFNVSKYLLENNSWSVAAIIYTSTDRIQHYFFHKEELLIRHYMQIDSYLGDTLNRASSEDADILIVSDHGFQLTKRFLFLNNFLVSAGYLVMHRKRNIFNDLLSYAKRRLGHYTVRKINSPIDFSASRAFSLAGHTIYLNQENEEMEKELIGRLIGLEQNGHPLIRSVLNIDEVMWGPYTRRAGQLYLEPAEGVNVKAQIFDGGYSYDIKDLKYPGGYGFHDPQGIMILWGPRVKRGVSLPDRRIWDIAPTILALRGLPIPDYFDGTPINDAFLHDLTITTVTSRDGAALTAKKLKFKLMSSRNTRPSR